MFSHDGSYGQTHLLQHRIITEDVQPIKCHYRLVNPALEPDLRRQVDNWLRHNCHKGLPDLGDKVPPE